MKKILVSMLTLVVIMFFMSSPATANGHKGEHVPVNVCHATNSDTNPYVFITVDDDSTKFAGHLMHRNDPNKTWKSGGTFNGDPHEAGDAKPDLIADYTDSDGVFHELDGVVTADTCVNHDTPPPVDTEVTPVDFGVTPAECDVDGALVIPAQPEGVVVDPAAGSYGPGTYTVTYTAEDGFVLTSDPSGTVTVDAATGDCPTEPPVVCESNCNPPSHHHHSTPPKHHSNPPVHLNHPPVTQNTVAPVPVEVEAGLATLDNASAQPTDDHAGWFVLGGLAILSLGVLGLRKSKN